MDEDMEEEDTFVEKSSGSGKAMKGILVGVVAVAIVLMFIGGIFMFLQNPLTTAADDRGDLKTADWLDFAGRIVFWMGAAALSAIMIIGGVLMKDLDPAVRFGMLFLAGLMLIGTGLAV